MTDEAAAARAVAPIVTTDKWKCDICQERFFPTLEEATQHEKTCGQRKLHPFFQPAPARNIVQEGQKKRKKKQSALGSKFTSIYISSEEGSTRKRSGTKRLPIDVDGSGMPRKQQLRLGTAVKDKGSISRQHQNNAAENSDNSIAMMLMDDKFIQQQRVLQFRIERQKLEAERSRRRDTTDVVERASPPPLSAVRHHTRAPLFPVPNHVHHNVSSSDCRMDIAADFSLWSRAGDNTCNTEGINDVTDSLPPLRSPSDWCNFECISKDRKELLLTEAWRGAVKWTKNNGEERTPPTVDDFSIRSLPDDLCGRSIRAAYAQLVDWMGDWRERRKRSLLHMKAKQEERSRRHAGTNLRKLKTKARQVVDDDDLWHDSDEENGNGLSALCLVKGPVGCGKSSMVQTLVRQEGCNLIELNSSQARGGPDLRKVIGEATQSFTNLQQQKPKFHPLFAPASSAQPKVTADENSHLSVILIDEVDIMYEEQGDNGFWPVLLDLAKRSKCPIILTANEVPSKLAAAHHMQIHISRPDVVECTQHLQSMINRCPSLRCTSDGIQSLEAIVKVYGCDLRRIKHELCAFALSDFQAAEFEQPPVDCGTPTVSLGEQHVHACEVVSDFAVLEAHGQFLPSLGGAAPGFGFDMTSSYPVQTNDNSKPPPLEMLLMSGWNDYCGFFGAPESFMVTPFCRRERCLLMHEALCSSGQFQKEGVFATEGGQQEQEEPLGPAPAHDFLVRPKFNFSTMPLSLVATFNPTIGPVDSNALFDQIRHCLYDFLLFRVCSSTQHFSSFNLKTEQLFQLSGRLDLAVWVDYMPIVFQMAQAAAKRFEDDPGRASTETFEEQQRSRRSNRRRRRQVNPLACLFPEALWEMWEDDFEMSRNDITRHFANQCFFDGSNVNPNQ